MAKKRTKQQKIKAQQHRPDQIAMIQSQYQFSAPTTVASKNNLFDKSTSQPQMGRVLHATDLFRYDTHLIYRDIIKTLVITFIMIITLVVISRFVH